MRRIKIGKEESRKRFWAIVFLVLLTLSTVGYAIVNSFGGSGGSSSDSGDFSLEGNYWTILIGSQKYYFSYLPSDLENVSISGEFGLGDYYDVPLYFTDENQGSIEILNNLGRYILRAQEACISEEDCDGDLPVKDCAVDNVVIFSDGDGSVRSDAKCVYLSGDSVKGADKFLYEVLKIK
ncbi:hypothetical protein CMI41_00875 [Candidatus Pacearchaeota archaeon]|nr:hypothetical protein [Candidatus Pacearchaeota archaeon]|tara:strand:+ start:1979 stop:2518 length:540 start_codon:yes stop_codon:yes gene_type:complete